MSKIKIYLVSVCQNNKTEDETYAYVSDLFLTREEAKNWVIQEIHSYTGEKVKIKKNEWSYFYEDGDTEYTFELLEKSLNL